MERPFVNVPPAARNINKTLSLDVFLSNNHAIIRERITSNLAFYFNYTVMILLVFQLQSKHWSSSFCMASASGLNFHHSQGSHTDRVSSGYNKAVDFLQHTLLSACTRAIVCLYNASTLMTLSCSIVYNPNWHLFCGISSTFTNICVPRALSDPLQGFNM